MKNSKKIIRMTVIVILVAVLFCLSFVIFAGNHTCTSEHCKICGTIEFIKDILAEMLLFSAAHILHIIFVCNAVCMVKAFISAHLDTLITLKVKLSN